MNRKITATLIATLSFISNIESKDKITEELAQSYAAYENIYKPLHPAKKSVKLIDFIPSDDFGGSQAQGKYDSKKQCATITHGDIVYRFTKMLTNRTNASLPHKKNLDPALQLIGSFNTKTNHAGMPVTTYVFGKLTSSTPPVQKPEAQDLPASESLMGSSARTWAPITFNPAEQFADDGLVGNYFASGQVATIHDPTGNNKKSYTFHNAQQQSDSMSENLVLIGSYALQPKCKGNICSHAMMMVPLYGTLQETEELPSETLSA